MIFGLWKRRNGEANDDADDSSNRDRRSRRTSRSRLHKSIEQEQGADPTWREQKAQPVGVAKYSELAKSMILGDESGMLKLLFDPETHKLLGVHALGQRATEIIHIGQAVLFYGGSVKYFRDMVFNYPTLTEAFKVAALNGLNKL